MAKIITTRLMPRGVCLNLFGLLLTRDRSWIDRYVVNHELIHTAQQRELLWLPFYLVYIAEWLVRLALTRNADRAYRSISFEREAYAHGRELGYLARRPHYAQWRRHQS